MSDSEQSNLFDAESGSKARSRDRSNRSRGRARSKSHSPSRSRSRSGTRATQESRSGSETRKTTADKHAKEEPELVGEDLNSEEYDSEDDFNDGTFLIDEIGQPIGEYNTKDTEIEEYLRKKYEGENKTTRRVDDKETSDKSTKQK